MLFVGTAFLSVCHCWWLAVCACTPVHPCVRGTCPALLLPRPGVRNLGSLTLGDWVRRIPFSSGGLGLITALGPKAHQIWPSFSSYSWRPHLNYTYWFPACREREQCCTCQAWKQPYSELLLPEAPSPTVAPIHLRNPNINPKLLWRMPKTTEENTKSKQNRHENTESRCQGPISYSNGKLDR